MNAETDSQPDLALQLISRECLHEKYCVPGETTADDVRRRVAPPGTVVR